MKISFSNDFEAYKSWQSLNIEEMLFSIFEKNIFSTTCNFIGNLNTKPKRY